MTPKQQKVHDYYHGGYNCAQSVFAAFHEEMGLSEELALKLTVSMGGGIGGLREVCGAVTAAAMALNMMGGEFDPADTERKKHIYTLVQEKADAFKAEHGTIICRELLERNGITPSPVPSVHSARKPCGRFLQTMAKLVEDHLKCC